MTRRTIGMLPALAIVAFGAALTLSVSAGDQTNHEGTLVGVRAGAIAIINRDATAIRTFPLAAFVKVTRNEQPANLGDLVRGDLVELTTDVRLGKEYVIAVAAIRRE